MLKNVWTKRLIAMLLIFTLTFANFALVTKTYATSIFDGLFSDDKSDTGSKNIEFDAYFVSGDSKSKEVKSDVNSGELNIGLTVKVLENGYLKDAKIILGNGQEVNFKVVSEDVQNEYVQSFDGKTLEFIQLNAGSNIELSIPIEYENSKYVDSSDLSKTNKIRFEGTYMNEKAEEVAVSKDVDLKLSWTDKREVRIDSEVTKFIEFNRDGVSGLIFQTSVKVDNSTENKSLPVKNSRIAIQVPEFNGVEPESINIVAKSLLGTSGKQNDEVVFGVDNSNYDTETNTLIINVENKAELIRKQNENEVLKDETIPEEELYYSSSGVDEYLITYIYSGITKDEAVITSNISANYEMFGNYSLEAEKDVSYEVSEQIGDIVTFSMESATDTISKGYTYLNYNNENAYEVQIDNKLIFNISYKDIVNNLYYESGKNLYVSKDGREFSNDDIYYKSINISKSNFDEILGEDGYINIYDENGNLLNTINKDMQVTDSGNYEVNFDSIKWIRIETSKPISEGNLVISAIRAYSKVSYGKEDVKNFEKITINSISNAKYDYLEDLVDIGNETKDIKLEDTSTEANLVIGQDSLSTLAMNNNVEIKLELNNEDIKSDVYGNSEFEIKMPEYVNSLDITDSSIVYGEGLELSSVDAFERDGNLYAKVGITGNQNLLSSGIISNGTNVVLNANIGVDLYAPATEGTFELRYVNNEATTYENEADGTGYSTETVKYSAPSGVVSVNSISNYNDNGDTITSVKQGKQTDEVDIYSEARDAKMELTIMNNESNSISNIAILGRIPFAGNKDIQNGADLGTTTTTKMISGISSENEGNFKIYYSENEDATISLNSSENGWMENVENFENIKSYLIIPEDINYLMESAEKLRFSYDFEIPENLEYNEEMYGTFGTYYTNNTNVATVNEVSIPDKVGLVTGVGPELDITTSVDKDVLNEFEELEVTTVVKNKGEVTAKNVRVEVPLPDFTTYSTHKVEDENISVSTENKTVIYEIPELEVGKEVKLVTVILVNEIISNDDMQVTFDIVSRVTADELEVMLQTEAVRVTVNQADMLVTIDTNTQGDIMTKGSKLKVNIRVKNLKSEEIKNVVTTLVLDKAYEIERAFVVGYEKNSLKIVEESLAEFDEQTRVVTWKFDSLNSMAVKTLRLELSVNLPEGSLTKEETSFIAKSMADGTEEFTSEANIVSVGKPSLTITQTSENTNSYVKEGEMINYKFVVKNEGSVAADSVNLVDKIPDGLVAKSISYMSNGVAINKAISEKDEVSLATSIQPGETLEVNIGATAVSLNGSQELSVTNAATVAAVNVDEITSNSITHIIEASEVSPTVVGETSTGTASSVTNQTTTSFTKTYKITGTAWLDKNNDGARSNDEQLMKGIKATLVDSDNGVIKQTTATNSKGEYAFAGVTNGNYIIIFDYDTVLYTVTTYQKENITTNLNSDAITTKIEQDGVLRNGAVTDVIVVTDGSISNIDIGLIEALKFDLNLNMGITNVTVQNSQGTVNTPYDNVSLIKAEVGAKQMQGTEIYIEYTFTVKNEGEISGYAKKIVDYVPEDMNFNSGINSQWYTGSDGNLYTTNLADVELMPGETRTFKLVLSRTMTNDNTGVVTNTAEIAEDYNIYGVSDMDSTPSNKAQKEDDFARADAYLSVRTGEVYIYISVIITTIILVGVAVSIVVIKLKYRLEKGGV